MADGSDRYVGRIGLTDAAGVRLLLDWRAPAAQPFYRATPAAPDGVVSRRHLSTAGRSVTGISDEVLDLDRFAASGCQHHHGVGRRGADAGAQRPADRPDARHRGDHPGRAGRDHPGADGGRAGGAGRPGHRQDGGGAAPGGLPALRAPPTGWPAAACWWSGRTAGSCTTSSRCCPAWARPAWCWPPPASCSPAWTPQGSRQRRGGGAQGRPADGPGAGRGGEGPAAGPGGAGPARGRGQHRDAVRRATSSRPAAGRSTPASRTTRRGSGSSATCWSCWPAGWPGRSGSTWTPTPGPS